MPRNDGSLRAILIVSSQDRFDAIVKKNLIGFITIDSARSAPIARRSILEKQYDICVINGPLTDESGMELAMDVAESGSVSVLLCVPREAYGDVQDRLVDYGILVLPKPFSASHMDQMIRYLKAVQNKMHSLKIKLQKSEDKMEELRVISRAKLLLVEKKHMTEDEAHRYIGKQAMDRGISRRNVADELIGMEWVKP